MVKRFTSDIDIDVADREALLGLIPHVKASLWHTGHLRRHGSGFYPTAIPADPVIGAAAIDYEEAERRGYIKLDLLNMSVYEGVRSDSHLTELMHREPPWGRLRSKLFCEKVIHISNWHSTMLEMPEPVDSIPRMMMFLAVIRPGKKHLIGKPWQEVAKTIWEKTNDGYSFRKAHAAAYAHLVAVHINLLVEQGH